MLHTTYIHTVIWVYSCDKGSGFSEILSRPRYTYIKTGSGKQSFTVMYK